MTDNIENKVKLTKGQKKNLRKKLHKDDKHKIDPIIEESTEDVVYPSNLVDLEEFELNGGFVRFKNVYEDDEKLKQEMALKENLRINDNLPMKAAVMENLQNKDDIEDEDDGKMNRKKWKRLNRISTGQLKLEVKRPDLVEPQDYCSKDPHFLLELKSKRNTVPVVNHWCDKGKYLQGKRGFVKPPFKLPDSIAKTGIMDIRPTCDDKTKSLKTQMKEKIRPKVGCVDISYQTLHDAFLVHLEKPELSKFGEIYYHGKEIEGNLRKLRPGPLSDELKVALGLPTGSNCDKYPPPYLIAQQRYGPPPSYPNLKIPGLNAPLPPGCSFGYHIGGWGKPPVDEQGHPIYGDVFLTQFDIIPPLPDDDFDDADDNKMWGEIESDEDEDADASSDKSDENEDESAADIKGEMRDEGLFTPAGIQATVTRVIEAPTAIELRKRPAAIEEAPSKERPLYKVLPEVEVAVGAAIMGTSKVYELPKNDFQLKKRKQDAVVKEEKHAEKGEPKPKKKKDFKF